MSKHMTSIGGQALIEGVMMRGPKEYSMAVRKPDGEIIIEKKPISSIIKKIMFFRIPILRGVVSFFESMFVGMQALMFSADFYDIDHMNVSGQKKLTEYLGRILVEDYSMEGNVRDPDVQDAWDTTAAYNRLFYQYCDEQLILESKLWISEDDKKMQLLDQMKTGE